MSDVFAGQSMPAWAYVAAAGAFVVTLALAAAQRRPQHQVTAPRPARTAEERRTRARKLALFLIDTVAPAIFAAAIVILAAPGLYDFARVEMGLPPATAWLIVVVLEVMAVWAALTRFADAQIYGRSTPVAALLVWGIIGLTSYLQYSHGVADAAVTALGAQGRGAMPLLLGVVIEYALHRRRSTVRRDKDRADKREFGESLKTDPIEYIQARRTLAAHPGWEAEQALARVRTQRVGRALRRVRMLLAEEPVTPTPPTPASGGDGRGAVDATGRAKRAAARAVARRDKRAARAKRAAARAVARRAARLARAERRAIAALDRLGFAGDPSGSASVDVLRDMQVRTRVREVARLDYSSPDEALALLGSLITADMADRHAGIGSQGSARHGAGIGTGPAPAELTGTRVESGIESSRLDSGDSIESPVEFARLDSIERIEFSDSTEPGQSQAAQPESAESEVESSRVESGASALVGPTHSESVESGIESSRVESDGSDAAADSTEAAEVESGRVGEESGDSTDPEPDPDGPRGGGAPAPRVESPAPVRLGAESVESGIESSRVEPGAPAPVLAWAAQRLHQPEEPETNRLILYRRLFAHAGQARGVLAELRDEAAAPKLKAPTYLYKVRDAWHGDVTRVLMDETGGDADRVVAELESAGVEIRPEVTAEVQRWREAHGVRALRPVGE